MIVCDKCGKAIEPHRSGKYRFEYELDGVGVKIFTNDNDLCQVCISEVICNGEEKVIPGQSRLFKPTSRKGEQK